jgi:hypothetical protein
LPPEVPEPDVVIGQPALARRGAPASCWAPPSSYCHQPTTATGGLPYDLPASLVGARAAGDSAAFDAGLAEGRTWKLDQAVAAGLAA